MCAARFQVATLSFGLDIATRVTVQETRPWVSIRGLAMALQNANSILESQSVFHCESGISESHRSQP
jgi:hypothetical protein